MKLSISNIAWGAQLDEAAYELMRKNGFTALEIAPTRIFPQSPYDRIEEARLWSEQLMKEHGIGVCSMQSIWYGRSEKLFGTEEERAALSDYTKRAILFAEATGCKNLVFGCPRNRVIPEGVSDGAAVEFFREMGNFAFSHNTVLAIEANPPIYNTNYINGTPDAIALIKAVRSPGFLLNLDVGTMIHNDESVGVLEGNVKYINHVHISEPNLVPLKKRELHAELMRALKREDYRGAVSIEMSNQGSLTALEDALAYVKEIFG